MTPLCNHSGGTVATTPAAAAKAIFREGVFRKWNTARPHPLSHLYAKELFLAVDVISPLGKHILDLGCGPGRFAVAFAMAGAASVTAVDVSPEVLAIARTRAEASNLHERISFCAADAENLPYREAAFDAVSCMQTFVHFPHPDRAAREMFRLCRSGGRFVATATNKDQAWVWKYPSVATLEVLLNRFPQDLRDAVFRLTSTGPVSRVLRLEQGLSIPHRNFTREEFRELFQRAGFELDLEVDIGRPAVFFLASGRRP